MEDEILIKFDRNVHLTLKALESKGFRTYAIGECVRDSIRGYAPYDWDLVTTASLEELEDIFEKGVPVGDEEKSLRIDFTYEVVSEDEDEPSRIEGVVCDIKPISLPIEEQVSQNGFTVNAIADNPDYAFVDPYSGREDIKKKLINTVKPADELFKERPIKMLEAIRTAAELDFDLHKSLYEAIVSNWRLLMDFDKAAIRNELERLLTSACSGKGLNMMADTGLMTVIFGEDVSSKMSTGEMQAFTTLCENIDKTKPVILRRLGLLYTCLNKNRGLKAIERMNFDDHTNMHLVDAMKELIKIQFLGNDVEFKRYLFDHGIERYEYLNNLSKAQRIVYEQPATKIEGRNHMMKTIISNDEPVFIEDLVIDENDLIEAGIVDSPEKAEELLGLVIAVAHDNPKNNQRAYLLKMAKKYSKSKLLRHTRYVKWLK